MPRRSRGDICRPRSPFFQCCSYSFVPSVSPRTDDRRLWAGLHARWHRATRLAPLGGEPGWYGCRASAPHGRPNRGTHRRRGTVTSIGPGATTAPGVSVSGSVPSRRPSDHLVEMRPPANPRSMAPSRGVTSDRRDSFDDHDRISGELSAQGAAVQACYPGPDFEGDSACQPTSGYLPLFNKNTSCTGARSYSSPSMVRRLALGRRARIWRALRADAATAEEGSGGFRRHAKPAVHDRALRTGPRSGSMLWPWTPWRSPIISTTSTGLRVLLHPERRQGSSVGCQRYCQHGWSPGSLRERRQLSEEEAGVRPSD